MSAWTKMRLIYIPQINLLFGLLFGRILFAALALSILICFIMLVRKKLSPNLRSWLWGLCIPALFIPFEHGVVAIIRSIYTPDLPSKFIGVLDMLRCVLPYLWLAGFIAFSIKTHRNQNNTMRLLRSNKLSGCASYFYKGRSHIYLPPDFEQNYTDYEREMLLAHENQHIVQHDPLLYRFMQAMQCIFWFNPLIHKAALHIRQDRELLCDERVIRDHPNKREYGMLLLREAQKAGAGHMLAGIVSEPGGVYERVAACVKPFSPNKRPAVIVAGIAALIFAVGLMGFVKPITKTPMDISLSIMQGDDLSLIENAERFVLLEPNGIALDQQGLLEYAAEIGLGAEQPLSISLVRGKRMTLTGEHTVLAGGAFAVGLLETEDIFFPYYGAGSTLFDTLFRVL